MFISFEGCKYEVIIEPGCIDFVFKKIDYFSKVLIITDDIVSLLYLSNLLNQRKNCHTLIIKNGEKSKNLDSVIQIEKKLIENNFSRNDLIISLGGGVIGDITGFAASIYKRGIKYIQIPTTSLSQIDSSIGGKTAIDFLEYKNIIGTFYHPYKVFIDTNTLSTLKKRHLYNGLIEALKISLLFDKDLFEIFNNNNIENNIDKIIQKSILLKKEIIEKDPFDKNIRKVLNFGHTIGHALESYFGLEKKLHGECVALGMLYFISSLELKGKVKNIINRFNISTEENFSIDEVIKFIKNDKKSSNSLIEVIVLNDLERFEIKKMTISEIELILKKGI